MDARQERGLIIAATTKIERNKVGWKVPSQSGNGTCVVNLDHGQPFCTCPDFEKGHKCKHIYAVEYVLQREKRPDGTTVVTGAVRVTYTQDWPVYNQAQRHEAEHFAELRHGLLSGHRPSPAATSWTPQPYSVRRGIRRYQQGLQHGFRPPRHARFGGAAT